MALRSLLCAAVVSCLVCANWLGAETVWVDDLDLSQVVQDYGKPTSKTSLDGHKLAIAGRTYERGFGTHAESWFAVRLDGKGRAFSAELGLDDEVKGRPGGTAAFVLVGDGKQLWSSGPMRVGDAALACRVDLAGVKLLELVVTDGGDNNYYDHADWAEAKIEADGVSTFATVAWAAPAPYILTPPPPAKPRINGARVFGVRSGSPFLFAVPATGDRPMKFAAKGLPAGLRIDPETGRITGRLTQPGTHVVTVVARNAKGRAERTLRIVCGDRIALTPPMGWNSWNCFAGEVSAQRVKGAAAAMVKTGLINHGWTYVNVDDFWQRHRATADPTLSGAARDADGSILPNTRFGDMKALADYIHGLGLKAGLYSSPGPWTCGGCAGSYGHERQDAEAYAAWGYDYLKYDWCSYGGLTEGLAAPDPKLPSVSWGKGSSDREIAKAPYQMMGDYLRRQPRDIVYSLCQYGMSKVWEWGGSVGGNSWRTTGDITGTWTSMSRIALAQDEASGWAKPGNWNDPDMLILGVIGWGNPQPTRLTPDEQYLHFSLWCLFSAPLLIGCDMEKLDAFTLSLLTNDEVIALDQDPLGQQAKCVDTVGDVRVYRKALADGSVAVGFCNFGRQPAELSYDNLALLGLSGRQQVRDLWRQQDLGTVEIGRGPLPLKIPTHGIVLLKFVRTRSAQSMHHTSSVRPFTPGASLGHE
jgi:alpha-galactosidase